MLRITINCLLLCRAISPAGEQMIAISAWALRYHAAAQPGLNNPTDHFLEQWFWRPAAIASYWAGRISGARSSVAWRGIRRKRGFAS
jgi:hypothetical protein